MKILLLTSSFPGKDKPVQATFVKELAEYLDEYDHHVSVLAPKTGPSDTARDSFGRNGSIYRFEYPGFRAKTVDATQKSIPLLSTFFFLLMMFFNAYRIIRKNRIDIIHCYWMIPSGFVGSILRMITRTPVVCTSPGSDMTVWSYRKTPGKFIKFTLSHIDHLFTLGSELRKRALELGIDEKKVMNILGDGGMNPNLFSPEAGTEASAELRKTLGLPEADSSRVALYIGRLCYPKRLDLVVPLLQKDPNLYLVVIGDGPDRKKYEKLAADLSVDHRIIFTGAVLHDDLPAYYAIADIVLYPSENEGLPSTIMEAMCMRKPIIASCVGGIPDLIENGQNGILVENSQKAFSVAYSSLFKDDKSDEFRNKLADSAYSFARDNLYYSAIIPQITGIYSRMLS